MIKINPNINNYYNQRNSYQKRMFSLPESNIHADNLTLSSSGELRSNLVSLIIEEKSKPNNQAYLLVPKKNKAINFNGAPVKRPTILVSGGTGYIGSHCVLDLIKNNYNCIIFDNTIKHKENLTTLIKAANEKNATDCKCDFIEGNLLDTVKLNRIFDDNQIDMVIHLAGSTKVADSAANPMKFYNNNVVGTVNILNSMIYHKVPKLIFASTSLTYGAPKTVPIKENDIQIPLNTYAKTKKNAEEIIKTYTAAYDMKSVIIRMFNISGINEELKISEDTTKSPSLIVATLNMIKNNKPVSLMGNDFNTKDGTSIRDYVHINDVSNAFVRAVKNLFEGGASDSFNLGSGKGYSIKEIFDSCERATGQKIEIELLPKRPGDSPVIVADNSKIKEKLGWNVNYGLDDIIKSVWDWQISERKVAQ